MENLEENDFFSHKRQQAIRDKQKMGEKTMGVKKFMLIICRVIHISSAAMTCGLIFLNAAFSGIIRQVPEL